MVFALIATIGSTYAWFTVSDTVTLSAIDLTVTTEDSLLIRVWDTDETETGHTTVDTYTAYGWNSPLDFSNVLTTDDILASTAYSTFDEYLLTPVTAAYDPVTLTGTDFQSLDMDNLSTISISSPANRALTPADYNQVSPNSGYIEIKFWVMSQETAATVKLSAFSSSGSTASNALYIGTKAETDTTENVYAVNSDWGFAFTSNDLGYITQDTSHDNGDLTFWNTIPTSGDDSYGIDKLQTLESTVNSDSDIVISLAVNTPEILTVRLWIEGWDAQATNAIMGDAFTVTFALSIIA